jgi:hypothetical protein
MNFKQYLLEQNEERRVDVTIKLYPKPNASMIDFIYDGDTYYALSYLKHDVIDDMQENFYSPFFEFVISPEQRDVNRSDEIDDILFSVIPSDHMIKYSDEDLKGEVYTDTKEILKSLKIKHEIILQDRTDRMRQSLKPETEKTFGGMLDEL